MPKVARCPNGIVIAALLILEFVTAFPEAARAQSIVTDIVTYPDAYGPYSAVFLPGGRGLSKPLLEKDKLFTAESSWSVYTWVRSDDLPNSAPASAASIFPAALAPSITPTLIAGVGDPLDEYSRFFALSGGKLAFWMGEGDSLTSTISLASKTWHLLAATFDGVTTHLYSDGAEVGSAKLAFGRVSPVVELAPESLTGTQHFGGKIADFTLLRRVLAPAEVASLSATKPDFLLINFEEGSKSWPIQTRGQAGYRAPQDSATLPRSAVPFSKPIAQPLPSGSKTLEPARDNEQDNEWILANNWRLEAVPKVTATGAEIAQPSFDSRGWMAATVPGTVLTTMIDRGVYPDPYYGLNNLAIPESLNKQDYWYRSEFTGPKVGKDRRLTLTFNGINYAAVIWLNGHRLGTIKGAFIRGNFDVTGMLKPGATNALAVQISPPPHPGIPQEQSVKGGPGENGGAMCLDGPTFVATEGWDWIPAIRDRDTGIWQDVRLTATGEVKLGDPQVVTTLPLPDTSHASIEITVPVANTSNAPVQGILTASFDQVTVTKSVTVAPGESIIKLTPAEFSQLNVTHPRLWWPNGYGTPELYTLRLSIRDGRKNLDNKKIRFGMREVTYELSLLDDTGHLRRLEYSPTIARSQNRQVVDVSHDGMREIPVKGWLGVPEKGWAASLVPGSASSAAITMLTDTAMTPYLVIKVNGVRIAAKGGNWGMDDARKRVSREHLEPFFRLHRDANLNIIRNWVGQNTEETFYDLADEYGLMVWNDFWASTEDYNIEPQDPALFLDNARDTILHYRNHPSIVMWCGRNEGVPQPIISNGLETLIRSLDGTRYYSPSSNQVNLQNSGPYRYQNPVDYYTTLNRGFSVETGTPSMSTLESFRHSIPAADQWPINDDWAYHDWHQTGNGQVSPFMDQLEDEFGAATSLEDFERKAQMLNYVDHRAIFEGMNAHLWAPNSGRLLWMTQPAWPSTMWQILSSDYDTQASFYGVKKAAEPIHIQLDLSDGNIQVVNNTTAPLPSLAVSAKVYSLSNQLLLSNAETMTAGVNSVTDGNRLNLAPLLATGGPASGLVLVKLELHDAGGDLLSDNFYWLGAKASSYRALTHLPAPTISATATYTHQGEEAHLRVQLQNTGQTVALAEKLTLESAADGARILPAYYSDNYVSLLPGESRSITIDYPAKAGTPKLELRGWNLPSATVPVTPH